MKTENGLFYFLLSHRGKVHIFNTLLIFIGGGDLGAFDIVEFEYLIPDGCTSLVIRQNNSGSECNPRRALQIPL